MGKKPKPEYTLKQKRSGRWAVIGRDGKNINGEDKAAILSKEGKIKDWKPQKKEEEAPAEEAAPAEGE